MCLGNASEWPCEQHNLCSCPFVLFIWHLTPQDANPCFKLQVFVIDFKLWQGGSASLGGDMGCLFFAVKRNKSVVNISWCSYKSQESPTTYTHKFPGTEIVVHQALMHRVFLYLPLPCIFVVHAWSWAASDNLILIEIETAEKLRGKNRIIVLWPL